MNISEILTRLTRIISAAFILFTVLPVKLNYSSIAIVSLTVLALFKLIYDRKTPRLSGKCLAFLSIPFWVYVLGLLNTSNTAVGMDYIARNASFLAFPIIFYALGSTIRKKELIRLYLIGLGAINIYLAYLFFYYYNFGERFYMVVTEDIYHATYLGMYNLVAYWICINRYRESRQKRLAVLSIIYVLAAVMTSTRIIFLLAVISIGTTAFIVAGSFRQRIALAIFTCILASLAVIKIPSIRQKFDQMREIQLLGFDKYNYESVSSRFGKIEASTNIIKRNILFGTGTGDLMDELRSEYKAMNFTMGYKYGYNPHNQYLDNLARNGVFGGGLALATIYLIPLYLGIKRRDLLLLAFIGVIGWVSLTESILDVHKGITFYVFFATMLIHAQESNAAIGFQES